MGNVSKECKRKKIDAYRLQNISATINPTEMVTQFCWVTI